MSFDNFKTIINKKGYRLSKDYEEIFYKNNKTKLKIEDDEGYLYFVSLSMFQKDSSPTKFGRGNIYTAHNMYRWVELNMSEKIEILSVDTNKIASKGVTFRCLECNKVYTRSWNSISSFHWCKSCSNKGFKYSTKYIKEMLKDEEIELLNDYNGIRSYAKCNCLVCNNKWETSFNALINNNSRCPKCDDIKKRGENNPHWKGGVTNLQEYIRNYIQPWRVDSYKKFNRCCDISGKRMNKNVIHHHYNFSDILKETLSILKLETKVNMGDYSQDEIESIKDKCLELHYKYGLGICLTEALHKEFHSIYGIKNNTIEQYLEFKQNKLKEMEANGE